MWVALGDCSVQSETQLFSADGEISDLKKLRNDEDPVLEVEVDEVWLAVLQLVERGRLGTLSPSVWEEALTRLFWITLTRPTHSSPEGCAETRG